jgi:hypothetical protein
VAFSASDLGKMAPLHLLGLVMARKHRERQASSDRTNGKDATELFLMLVSMLSHKA